MDKANLIEKVNEIESLRYSNEAFVSGVLLPELSIPIKMPTDVLKPSHAFIQKRFLSFTPNSKGRFICYWVPGVVYESPRSFDNFAFCNSEAIGTRQSVDKYEFSAGDDKFGILDGVATQARVVASSIKVKCLKRSKDENEYNFITATVAMFPTSRENGVHPIDNAIRNAHDKYSSRFGSVLNNWATVKNKADVGGRCVYIPREGSDYEFKNLDEFPKSVQVHIFWGEDLPCVEHCIDISIVRHIEITVEEKFIEILRPYALNNMDMLHSIKAHLQMIPSWGDKKGNLIVNSENDVTEIEQVINNSNSASLNEIFKES